MCVCAKASRGPKLKLKNENPKNRSRAQNSMTPTLCIFVFPVLDNWAQDRKNHKRRQKVGLESIFTFRMFSCLAKKKCV